MDSVHKNVVPTTDRYTTNNVAQTTLTGLVQQTPKMGSRRIFAPQFKIQVLDSYRHDNECKGNQRATARKYGIHRRQIQKWLQCEKSLRVLANKTESELTNSDGNGTMNNSSNGTISSHQMKENTINHQTIKTNRKLCDIKNVTIQLNNKNHLINKQSHQQQPLQHYNNEKLSLDSARHSVALDNLNETTNHFNRTTNGYSSQSSNSGFMSPTTVSALSHQYIKPEYTPVKLEHEAGITPSMQPSPSLPNPPQSFNFVGATASHPTYIPPSYNWNIGEFKSIPSLMPNYNTYVAPYHLSTGIYYNMPPYQTHYSSASLSISSESSNLPYIPSIVPQSVSNALDLTSSGKGFVPYNNQLEYNMNKSTKPIKMENEMNKVTETPLSELIVDDNPPAYQVAIDVDATTNPSDETPLDLTCRKRKCDENANYNKDVGVPPEEPVIKFKPYLCATDNKTGDIEKTADFQQQDAIIWRNHPFCNAFDATGINTFQGFHLDNTFELYGYTRPKESPVSSGYESGSPRTPSSADSNYDMNEDHIEVSDFHE